MPDMKAPAFFFDYDEVSACSLMQFEAVLRATPRKRLGSITLAELSATPQPIGLYFLFDDQQCLQYVGKSSSRSFIERIPSHLDPRPDGWFNTLPKKLIARSPLIDYRSALEHALGLDLVLLGVPQQPIIPHLETTLRSYLQPALNAGKPAAFAGTRLLSQCVEV